MLENHPPVEGQTEHHTILWWYSGFGHTSEEQYLDKLEHILSDYFFCKPLAMRRIPSSIFDVSIENDNLKKPSPSAPNAEPGTVITRSFNKDFAVSIDGPYCDTSSIM